MEKQSIENDKIKKLIYKGKFFNGVKYGQGNEYDEKGNLIYEGEFFNGERNGNGNEYDENGNLVFEGEFRNGKRWNGLHYRENNLLGEIADEYFILNGKKTEKNQSREYSENESEEFESQSQNYN